MLAAALGVAAPFPNPPKHALDPLPALAQLAWVENTADDPSRRKPDITKAKTLLGWEPKIKLEDGLKLMVDDFKKWV